MPEIGFLERDRLQVLLDALQHAGYRCVGPQVRDGAIVFDAFDHADALPRGFRDDQAPGAYRLIEGDGERCFDWAVGAQALKPICFAPREHLWRSERDERGALQFLPVLPQTEKTAVFGVRACDLAALALQDQHFLEQEHVDPYYQQRREGLFLVAVHCTKPADTCFCVSTGDGPAATGGFDIALHELDDGYLVESGSEQGAAIAAALDLSAATEPMSAQAATEIQTAIEAQQRTLPGRNLRETLERNLDHKRWEQVAARCLSCGNCTMVCPTCFCHGESELPILGGSASDHYRHWDSCFNDSHSYFATVVVRDDTRLRYRQWLTHKLGFWHEQYGRSGCVGCGRCITWCPVGIDITKEATAICGDDNER